MPSLKPPSLEPLCTLNVVLSFSPVGKVRTGMRLDVPFEGTATSPHWEGERSVSGIDYVTVGQDGSMELDIRGQIRSGRDVIGYRAIGRNPGTDDDADPRELLVFETPVEEFAWLNSAVAVGSGKMDGTSLRLEVFVVTP